MSKKTVDLDVAIETSGFIDLWKKQMEESLLHINPDLDKDIIDEVLNEEIKEKMQLPEVVLDNNFTGETRDTNLLSVLDWVIDRKPLIAGNGTFYKNQHEAINPIAAMLDGFLKERKALKKKMFAIDDPESDVYKDLDRGQQNQKILCNSYYGASGMPKSAFFSKWSGPSTTGTAQSVISTTETFFEAFLVDNYKFIDINECFFYMNSVISQDYEIKKWIIPVSAEDVFLRVKGMFYDDVYDDSYERLLMGYIINLSDDDRAKIFYKNNIIEFTRRHKNILKLYDELFSSVRNLDYIKTADEIPSEFHDKFSSTPDNKKVKSYNNFVNNQYFMDPNSPPDTIKEILEKLNKYYMTYVYMPYMSFDRIHRLKYFQRKTVCIVDTDSNILALDQWVDFCRNEVLQGMYGRDDEHNKFIIINTLTYFITSAVSDILDQYGKHSNIPEEFRGRFGMKNELSISSYKTPLIAGNCYRNTISSQVYYYNTKVQRLTKDTKYISESSRVHMYGNGEPLIIG